MPWHKKWRDQPWHELPPEIARVLTRAPRRRRRDHRRGEAGAGLLPTARGASSARASARASRRLYVTFWRRSRRAARSSATTSTGRSAAGRCAPAAASSAAERLPGRRPRGLAAFAAPGVEAGLEPETLYLLAESIFAYIDMLSAESAEGYAIEQSAAASEAELRRRRLVRMLVREPPLDRRRSRPRRARPAGSFREPRGRWRSPGGGVSWRRYGCRRTRSPRRSGTLRSRSSPTRMDRGVAPYWRGPSRTPALGAGLGTTVEPARRRPQLRPGAGRTRARARRSAVLSRTRLAGELLLRSGSALAFEFAHRPVGTARAVLAGRFPGAHDRDARRVARRAGTDSVRSPERLGHASADRPLPARASARAVRRGARRSRERFWLELALRVTS